MSMLNRAILSDILKVFALALVGVTVLLLVIGVTKQALDEHLGPLHIVRLLPYLLPDALRFSLPGTALFAVCSVYGRLSASNEVVAIKALGINPMVVLFPTYFVAALLSLLAVVMNDVAVSWGRNGAQRVILESIEEIAYGILSQTKSYNRDPRYSITVKDVLGKRLIGPTIMFRNSSGSPITVTAEEAELQSTPGSNTLTFIIHYGSASSGGTRYVFDMERRQVPLSLGAESMQPSRLPLRDIPAAYKKKQQDLQEFERTESAKLAFEMLTGGMERVKDVDSANLLQSIRRVMYEDIYRFQIEPHRRWANGFAVLCFVLVGAPLAIQRRDAHFLQTFFLCFLPILTVYYPLYAVTMNLCKMGSLPSLAVWSGNVILACWGLWLLHRVIRY